MVQIQIWKKCGIYVNFSRVKGYIVQKNLVNERPFTRTIVADSIRFWDPNPNFLAIELKWGNTTHRGRICIHLALRGRIRICLVLKCPIQIHILPMRISVRSKEPYLAQEHFFFYSCGRYEWFYGTAPLHHKIDCSSHRYRQNIIAYSKPYYWAGGSSVPPPHPPY